MDCTIQIIFNGAYGGGFRITTFATNDLVNIFPQDPAVFLESTAPAVERLINSINSAGKKVNVVLTCKMVKTDPATGKNTYTVAHFRSKTHTMFDNVRDEYSVICKRVLGNFANFQRMGSGWRLHTIKQLEIYITKFDLIVGKSYSSFTKKITSKKAVISIGNYTVREVLMKNRTSVWRNVYNIARATHSRYYKYFAKHK